MTRNTLVPGYSVPEINDSPPSDEEREEITNALNGLPTKMITLPPDLGGVVCSFVICDTDN